MRISDWSSDVCSSDLRVRNRTVGHLRVVTPALLAGTRVETDEDIVRRSQIDAVADLQLRGFRTPALLRQIAGVVAPDFLQLRNVVARNLRQRRKARRLLAAAVRGTVVAGGLVGGLRNPRNRWPPPSLRPPYLR